MNEEKKIWLVRETTVGKLEGELNDIAGVGYQVFSIVHRGVVHGAGGYEFVVTAFDPVQLMANMQKMQASGMQSIIEEQLKVAVATLKDRK